MTKIRKKLIEVALPLEAINLACVAEGSPFTPRHPRSLHVWWARRRLAVARAIIFAQTVDDPSSITDEFRTEQDQQKERERLFRIIEDLVKWENTTNKSVIKKAHTEIWASWHRCCRDNADHPLAKELFQERTLPAFYDPFAGGGAIPLEAQRLGFESYASDLNPVAVLINKAMIEIPSKFFGKAAVNPASRKEKSLDTRQWTAAQGLAEDISYYGQWIHKEAEKRISDFYPKVEVTEAMAKDRSDLNQYIGQNLTPIAWLWARTVRSPNPAFSNIDVPLVSNFMLSTKGGHEAYVEPIIAVDRYNFEVKLGIPSDQEKIKNGTSAGKRKAFLCLMSGVPISYDYIRTEAKAGRMGARLLAIVAESSRGRVYLSPNLDAEEIALKVIPTWKPDCEMPVKHRNFQPPVYGMNNIGDLFTSRQLLALSTFSNLIGEVRNLIHEDAVEAGFSDDNIALDDAGIEAPAYSEAVSVYLSLCLSRWTDLYCNLSSWNSTNQNIKNLFSRQAIPMTWDFAESNPFGSGASFVSTLETIRKLFVSLPASPLGHANQMDAGTQSVGINKIISTDPPYYDNISYADLSDFFYVWLRLSQRPVFPELFSTLAVPKAQELIAASNRHGSKLAAEKFFLDGMTRAMKQIASQAHPSYPISIYYAFKQAETDDEKGTASTGWETFLEATNLSGLAIIGTWPVRTERTDALKKTLNALASSIVLVCRPREADAPSITRREFIAALKVELPPAIARMQAANVAPVDLAQAAIGPGMAVYTRYSEVLDVEGKPVPVRDALKLINEVLDETLAEQEGDFDANSRWAITWFEQNGFAEGDAGTAILLSTAKGTALNALEESGIVQSGRGKVRLFKPSELPEDWDPATDPRLTHWEIVHHLIRVLQAGGEAAAAALVAKLGSKAETARELAYRLYTVCERKKRAAEALSYNALVQSWPEILRLSQEAGQTSGIEPNLFSSMER